MDTDTVAHTYAQALLEAALEKGLLDDVLEEVNFFGDRLREDRELRLFVENPRCEKTVKTAVLQKALRGKVSDVFVNFLCLTIDKGRQMFLPDILEQYKALHDEKVGIVRAEATSAVPMSEEAVTGLKNIMMAKLKKQILITNRVDSDVLGGVVVRFGGVVADGSLKTALDEIRSSMSSVKFGSEMFHEN